MNDITFKRHSWHYKLWRAAHGCYRKCPANFCDYWWQLLLAVLTFPLWSIVALISKRNNCSLTGKSGQGILIYLFWIVSWMLSCALFADYLLPADNNENIFKMLPDWVLWLSVVTGPIILTTIIVIVAIMFVCGSKVIVWLENNRSNKKSAPTDSVFVTFIRSKREKYCAKINWID